MQKIVTDPKLFKAIYRVKQQPPQSETSPSVIPNVNSSAGCAGRIVLANTALMCRRLADSWRRERGQPPPSTGSCFSPRTYPPLHQ